MNVSPLRYSGSKQKFTPNIIQVINQNRLHSHFAEPFAGGGAVALNLLLGGYVTDIHLNELDKAVYAFWQSILVRPDDFMRKINDTAVTMEHWHRSKAILSDGNAEPLDLGFAAFFLNRTNRSGILRAGVIGGLDQTGNYKMDCRFNKPKLIKRIEMIAEKASSIHLTNLDALVWLKECSSSLPTGSLIYLDPPYYEKGHTLYRHYYKHQDHVNLHYALNDTKQHWVLSYDNHPEIVKLYSNYRQRHCILNYSTNKKMKATELIVYSRDLIID